MADNNVRLAPTQGKRDPKGTRSYSAAQVTQMVMDEARRRGMSWFRPFHAAGMVGSFMQETGNFRDDVIDFRVRGDDGTAHGLMQWRGDRFKNLLQFGKGRNQDPGTMLTQVAFAMEEADPSSPYSDFGSVRAFKDFKKAKNSRETATYFTAAERSAGWNGKYGSATDTNLRINHAQKAMSEFRNSAPEDLAYEGGEGSPYTNKYEAGDFGQDGPISHAQRRQNMLSNAMTNTAAKVGSDSIYDQFGLDKDPSGLRRGGPMADKFGLESFINNQSNNPFLEQQKRGRFDAFGAGGGE